MLMIRSARVLSPILASLLLASVVVLNSASAGQVTTPKPGSPERKAIMDGLRIPVEKELHQKVIFVVNRLSVQGSWAFTITVPKQPNGRNVDYQKTSYRNAVKPGQAVGDAFSGEVVALLRKRNGHWKPVDYRIGPSDVCWEGWDKKYGAPLAIMKIQ